MKGRRCGVWFLRLSVFCLLFSISSVSPAQGPFDFGKRSSSGFCSVGGRSVRVEMFNPTVPGVYPAVIMLHGADGMDKFGDEYRLAGRMLARSGYVGILVHYFDVLSPQGNDEASWYRSAMDPRNFAVWSQVVRDSVTFATQQCNVDSSRIGVLGFSLGGYLAVSAGATDPRIRTVVEFFGGIPAGVAKHVKNLPPTLVLHGEDDDTVPVSEAYKLAEALRRHRVPNNVIIYPCQGHTFSGYAKKDAAEQVRCFLDTYLK